jgi:multidrug efflux pump subunit AcrA (membrane-fusion protein)
MTLLMAGQSLPASEPAPVPAPQPLPAINAEKPAPAATWVAASRGRVRQCVPTVGTWRARQVVSLGSQVSGRVAEVLVNVGDEVVAGQELVRLDPVFFQIALDSRQADLAAAQARAETQTKTLAAAQADLEAMQSEGEDAELNLARMKALWDKPSGPEPSIARKQYDDAITRARTAKARLAGTAARLAEAQARQAEAGAAIAQVEAGLHQTRQNLAETVIKAPFAGVVFRRLVDPGAPVTSAPATFLLDLQESARLYLEFSLPQELLTQVGPGTAVTYAVEGGVSGETQVATVFPFLDEATRAVHLRCEVDNPGRKLQPGMLAQVQVVLKVVADALIVPNAALKQAATGWTVTTKAGPKPVTIGIIDGDRAQIVGGLKPGDEVQIR